MLTKPFRLRARHRVSRLVSVCFLLACGAPQEPIDRPAKAGPLPTAVIRIPGDPNLALTIGAGVQLSAVMEDARGVEVLVPATWSSSNTAVVEVDSSGSVSAVGYGEASISAFYGGGLAKVMVSTRPGGLRVRQLAGGVVVEEGESAVVVAEFLDVNGEVIVMPWDVTWATSAGTLVPGNTQQTQLLRGLPEGEIGVVATSGPFRASLRLPVRPGTGTKLTVPHFTLWADALPNGQMTFYPDLVVVAPFEATIERLEFSRPFKSVCANAAIAPDATTPLFDFIPYDFSWQDGSLTPGSVVEAVITYRLSDGSIQTSRALGLVTTWARGTVIDYSTGGFSWRAC